MVWRVAQLTDEQGPGGEPVRVVPPAGRTRSAFAVSRGLRESGGDIQTTRGANTRKHMHGTYTHTHAERETPTHLKVECWRQDEAHHGGCGLRDKKSKRWLTFLFVAPFPHE